MIRKRDKQITKEKRKVDKKYIMEKSTKIEIIRDYWILFLVY